MTDNDLGNSGYGVPGAPAPLLAAVATVNQTLGEAADLDPMYLSVGEKQQVLRDLYEAEARLAGLRLQVLAVSGDIAAEIGAKDVSAWCATELRVGCGEARADVRLATALDTRWHLVAAAVGDGSVSLAQARVIVRVLDELPDGLASELLARAEKDLVGYAGQFGPTQLARLGRGILEHL
ncbi:MAG: DUF222 domain-containing protein, partial [Nocardioides sp.]|uniref:DUF222 domain-containing protein n=1 Tax=Nocardioides sp. TaxID=35761 RepID=UPI0039E246C0